MNSDDDLIVGPLDCQGVIYFTCILVVDCEALSALIIRALRCVLVWRKLRSSFEDLLWEGGIDTCHHQKSIKGRIDSACAQKDVVGGVSRIRGACDLLQ